MMRIRAAAAAATIVCAVLLAGGTGVASAQTGPARLTQVVPLTGTAQGGKQQFTGRYTIEEFVTRGGKLFAVGTVTGKVGNKPVRKENVRMPATVANASAIGKAAQATPPLPLPPLPPGNACSILALDLGPINLNLLGLVVRTNQIQLRVDAVQGAGNLLGNLLCGITGILNPATIAGTPVAQLAQVLNALLALSPRTA
jgi:hypothetical protein